MYPVDNVDDHIPRPVWQAKRVDADNLVSEAERKSFAHPRHIPFVVISCDFRVRSCVGLTWCTKSALSSCALKIVIPSRAVLASDESGTAG